MGLYDRDYTRGEPRGFGAPEFLGRSMVTTLIIINVAVFVADLLFGGPNHSITYALSDSGNSLAKPWLWWQLLTSGFAHDPEKVMHLVFNMFGLWMFGRVVEESLGRWEFLRFYLIAIVFGNLIHTARICLFIDPQWWGYHTSLGASGGVVAVIILFVCMFPHAKLLLFFAIPTPAWVVGVIIVGLDVLGSGGIFLNPLLDDATAARVGYDVHLAGAAFAVLYYFTGLNFGRLLPSNWGRLAAGASKSLRSRPKLRVHTPVDEEFDDKRYQDLDEEADRILAKINAHGESSLTLAERRVLEDYSRRMRQKHR